MIKPKLKFTEIPNGQREISKDDKVCGNCKWRSNCTFEMTLKCFNTNSPLWWQYTNAGDSCAEWRGIEYEFLKENDDAK